MKVLKVGFVLVMAAMVFSGCAATYAPPVESEAPGNYSRIVDAPFDEVWNKLIDYSAGTFFAIDNYEKDSGLLTLSFGAGNPSEFITGGQFKVSSISANFDGDYVDYLSLYHGGNLAGKMNIVARSTSDNKTKVTVNARYIFTSPPHTWSFDSGGCATIQVKDSSVRGNDKRTICPTYLAEQTILDALDKTEAN